MKNCTEVIKEPWDTPQRATPKSCYPCKIKSEKFSEIQKNIKKQLEKTIHAFQNEIKKIKKQKKDGTNPTKKNKTSSKKKKKFEINIRKKSKYKFKKVQKIRKINKQSK